MVDIVKSPHEVIKVTGFHGIKYMQWNSANPEISSYAGFQVVGDIIVVVL